MKVERKQWASYFLDIADMVATRATCDRKHVGCVIVSQDKVMLSAGYNGSARGEPHCDDAGHDMVDGHCVRTVHAEANAVAQAARNGVRIGGAVAFVNTYPCWPCTKLLVNAGVARIVFRSAYREDPRVDALCKAGRLFIGADGSDTAKDIFLLGANGQYATPIF